MWGESCSPALGRSNGGVDRRCMGSLLCEAGWVTACAVPTHKCRAALCCRAHHVAAALGGPSQPLAGTCCRCSAARSQPCFASASTAPGCVKKPSQPLAPYSVPIPSSQPPTARLAGGQVRNRRRAAGDPSPLGAARGPPALQRAACLHRTLAAMLGTAAGGAAGVCRDCGGTQVSHAACDYCAGSNAACDLMCPQHVPSTSLVGCCCPVAGQLARCSFPTDAQHAQRTALHRAGSCCRWPQRVALAAGAARQRMGRARLPVAAAGLTRPAARGTQA